LQTSCRRCLRVDELFWLNGGLTLKTCSSHLRFREYRNTDLVGICETVRKETKAVKDYGELKTAWIL